MVFGSIAMIILSLLVLFTSISFSKSPIKQTELMSVPVPSSELIADTPADADTSELINYFVETTLKPNTESKGTKQIGSIELKSGAGFRFHFSAQQSGHLYIIGTGANNHQTTFLTDKPTADSGVTTNLINVHQDYSFPSNNWITLGNIPGVESYTLLFTSKPINLDFLQAKAGHTLSSKEVEKLIQFLATTRKPLTKLFTDREQTACLQVPKEKFSETISFSISINHE